MEQGFFTIAKPPELSPIVPAKTAGVGQLEALRMDLRAIQQATDERMQNLQDWVYRTFVANMGLIDREFQALTAQDVTQTWDYDADTDVVVKHDFGLIPRQAYIVDADMATVCYRGSQAWTRSTICVRFTQPHWTGTLRIER